MKFSISNQIQTLVFWKYYKSKTIIKQGIWELNIDHTNTKSQTTEDGEKANILADYFSNVFTTEPPGSIPM